MKKLFLLALIFTFNISSSYSQSYKQRQIEDQIIAAINSQGKLFRSPKYGVYVFNIKDNKPIFIYEQQGFDINEQLFVASSSKWVSAAVIMGLVKDGILSLNDKTKYFLKDKYGNPWAGPKGEITLEELLSFRSGFLGQGRKCFIRKQKSLAECVNEFYEYEDFSSSKPFYYGNIHHSIAARIAEIASGKDWDSLFNYYLKTPLNFSYNTYYTNLRNSYKNKASPFISGGLYISTNDYIKFLTMLANNGHYAGKQILPQSLIEEMEKNHFNKNTKIESSPVKRFGGVGNWGYGFGNWVRCTKYNCQDQINIGIGAYGMYPWIDRKHGYYAIISVNGKNRGWSRESSKLFKKIHPLIEEMILYKKEGFVSNKKTKELLDNI